MKVLVVEDLTDDRRLLKYNIARRGHVVLEAANGQEALATIERERPDLIVSDLLMPVLDGFGLLKKIKETEGLCDIPFIVYSSVYTGSNERQLALSLGADGFLVKPLVPDALWQGIEEIMVALPEKGSVRTISAEHQNFLEKYAVMVAARLEAKVRELTATQQDLAEKEQKYRCLFSSMQDAILILDMNREVIDANQPALRRQLGYELEEIVGREFCSLFQNQEEAQELQGKICTDDLLGQAMEEGQGTVLKQDGTAIVCRISVGRLLDEKEEVTGRIVMARDVSAQIEAEQEIGRARQEWEQTFDSIDDIVTLQNEDMRVKRINAAGVEFFGKDAGALEGSICYELFRGISEPCLGCPLTDNLADFHHYSAEIHHERLHRTFLLSATPVVDQNGQNIGIAHFAKDITEKKEVEKQLRQFQKLEAIGTLAGGIAHDFNNILTAIVGYTQFLTLELEPGSSAEKDAQEVLVAANRAKDLVQQILSFSRSGEQSFHPLRVQSIVKEALKLLRASLPSTIEIKQEIDENCPLVQGDATQVHQIVMNFCTNAYQAMQPTGGVLSVRLTREILAVKSIPDWPGYVPGPYVQLEVSDTGCGITKENLEKIFEPYFSTKSIGEGTGLGLSVVHGIVKIHSGHLTVVSEPRKGSCFTVYLPIIEEQVELPVPETGTATAQGRERVLVVDDEKMLVSMETRMLELLGYTVDGFAGSVEAWEAFCANPDRYDLVVTDMTMPKMTGLDLVRRIRELRQDLPVIMCSGFSEHINEKVLREVGVRYYLAKPMSQAELGNMARRALDERQKIDQDDS